MAFGPITLWHINEGKVEIVADFILLGSKITVDSDCSYKIKRHLLFGRKAMTNLTMYQKAKVMAPGPIPSWQVDGETMETEGLYFLGLQNHCRW